MPEYGKHNAPMLRALKRFCRDKQLPDDTLEKMGGPHEEGMKGHIEAEEAQTYSGFCKSIPYVVQHAAQFDLPVTDPSSIAKYAKHAHRAKANTVLVVETLIPQLEAIAAGNIPTPKQKAFLKSFATQGTARGVFSDIAHFLRFQVMMTRLLFSESENQDPTYYKAAIAAVHAQIYPGVMRDEMAQQQLVNEEVQKMGQQWRFTAESLDKIQKFYDQQVAAAIGGQALG